MTNSQNTTSRKPLLIGGGVVLAAVVAWLAFGFFGIQSAFTNNEVSEAGPLFDSGAELATDTESDTETDTDTETDSTDASDADNSTDSDAAEDTPATTEPASAIVEIASGNFSADKDRYDVNGQAVVLNDGSEQRFLRFEDFNSTNGPDLKVYLRAENGDFVSLGELKGNIGEQNYEIPTDVDLSVFNTVEIWCERFSVGFGSAVLG